MVQPSQPSRRFGRTFVAAPQPSPNRRHIIKIHNGPQEKSHAARSWHQTSAFSKRYGWRGLTYATTKRVPSATPLSARPIGCGSPKIDE